MRERPRQQKGYYFKPAISTVCIGQAASMGSLLLAAGEKAARFALPNSRIMIHQPSGGAQGQATDIFIKSASKIYGKTFFSRSPRDL